MRESQFREESGRCMGRASEGIASGVAGKSVIARVRFVADFLVLQDNVSFKGEDRWRWCTGVMAQAGENV